ncbi:catalase-domain-containing protein [Hyaloscypha variabilis F]|uniref:Catalase n=1 Tax=Hyaloscypha variabilis (strain UAMH 11265 / GT02V1 / F) TaxID=1149755 RepID=A0A2J6S8F7_HYAVF|nr:catalase-domain-containing protein [Hyaloscypha variabilis F]
MQSNQKAANMKHEIHEPTSSDPLTSDFGVKSTSHDIWLSASTGDRKGPQLLEDNFAREKIMKFDHERIPERVVHARGAGAFGTFKLYESASDVTSAGVLTDTSRTTPVFVRFSTVLGSRGSADTVRDVRGFAVKFYTEEGNWDIVGNDIPVFFIQDAMKFPDVIHAGKPEPDTEVPQAQSAHNNFWDFQFLHTEATHMFMWAMSDRGIPRSYRMMQGFGVNTYTLTKNDGGERNFVKFHFTPTLGVHSLVWDEALKLAGQDPDFHRKDLYTAIDMGVYPVWKFGIQVCPESRQDEFDFDLLDATKVWPEELFPVRYIGEMQLNKNVDEYFTQTEQVAFCTAHIVPGIGFSDDPLLQGRNFSYFDTQLSRLGVNWQELPINRPVCPVMNNHRDGQLRHKITKGSINYWPNRKSIIPPSKPEEGGYLDYPEKVVAMKQRLHSVKFSEHFSQAQLFWNSMSEIEKSHIIAALGFELDHCDDPVVYERMVTRLCDISLELAQAVAEKAGAPTPTKTANKNHGLTAKGLSQFDFTPEALGLPATIASRMIAIIIGEGFNFAEYEAVKAALSAAGAFVFTVGPKRQPVKSSTGQSVAPDHHFEGMRSTMFDSLYIPSGEHVASLMKQGRVIHWVREAFGHCKAIGATGEGVALVKMACQIEGIIFSAGQSGEVVDSYGVVTASGVGRPTGVTEALKMVRGAKTFLDAYAFNISQHRNFKRELDGLTSLVAY